MQSAVYPHFANQTTLRNRSAKTVMSIILILLISFVNIKNVNISSNIIS